MTSGSAAGDPGFWHAAVFYRDAEEYLREIARFARGGIDAGEAVFIAVPEPKIGLLRGRMGGLAARIAFADMIGMGANPAWIIPAVRAFIGAHSRQRLRYVGEPVWKTRTSAELTEAIKHEALINVAFAGSPVTVLCPYDVTRLDEGVLASVSHTHPHVIDGGRLASSPGYTGTAALPAECDQPLDPPPPDAATLAYHSSLAPVRDFVRQYAHRAGMATARARDLVLAVHELTANTLRHTGSGGVVHCWTSPGEVICQVSDSGYIRDPLAGRLRPAADARHGQGLWVVNRLCDLVETRTGPDGTTTRVRIRHVPEAWAASSR